MADIAEAAAPTKNGLPRQSFAYAPTSDPDTWSFPYLTAEGRPDPDTLPAAAAKLSEGGDIPDQAMLAVKARLRQAYKRMGRADDMPASIREVEVAVEQAFDQLAEEAFAWSVKEAAVPDVDLEERGARNSAKDQSRIQAAHDATCAAGAKCSMDNLPEAESAGEDTAEGGEPMQEAFTADGPETDIRFSEAAVGGIAMVTLAEAGAEFDDARREVWITPIRPGFGNPRDKRYYPLDTVREAVANDVFKGRKMYANHPTKHEEAARPERDVRDWVGVIRETVWDANRGVPRARVQVVDDAVYAKWKAAPDQVAFSVLGKGKARSGRVGDRDAQIVESIARINSVDWVTEAGAGGSIDFAEADYDEEFEMADIAKMTPAQLREAAPELYAAIREAEDDEKDEQPKAGEPKEAAKTEAKDDKASGSGTTDASAKPPAIVEPPKFVSQEEFDDLKRQLAEMKVKEAAAVGRAQAQDIVGEMLREANLPRVARDFVADRFRESAIGEGFGYADDQAFRAEVEHEISGMQKVAGSPRRSAVTGLGNAGGEAADQPKSLREAMQADIDGRLGADTLPAWPSNGKTDGFPAGNDLAGKAAVAEDRISARM